MNFKPDPGFWKRYRWILTIMLCLTAVVAGLVSAAISLGWWSWILVSLLIFAGCAWKKL